MVRGGVIRRFRSGRGMGFAAFATGETTVK